MIGLLKAFGKGLLYVVGLPFFLIALLLFAVIGLFLFIFQIIRSIIYFFTGQTFFPELQEDKELRLKKEAAERSNEIIDQAINDTPEMITPLIEEKPIISEQEENEFATVEEACFKESETDEIKEEENVLETLTREEPLKEEIIEEEDSFENAKEETIEMVEKEINIAEEEELEEYIPKGTSITQDIDDEDTSTGVDIDFDL